MRMGDDHQKIKERLKTKHEVSKAQSHKVFFFESLSLVAFVDKRIN